MTTSTRLTIPCDPLTVAYLRLAEDECAFIETHTAHSVPTLLAALQAQGLAPEQVRYIVVTHAHLDHASGAGALMRACPNATLLAHPRAARHLIEPSKLIRSASAVYGEQRFAEMYGTIEPIPAERVRALADGETFTLGADTFQVWHTAGHANHHFVIDDPATGTVYTGDTFGLVYPALQGRGRFAIPSTSPTNFNAAEARKSIERVLGLGEPTVCLTHFGEWRDLAAIAEQLHRFIDRAEAWVIEAAAGDETVEAITDRLKQAWRQAVAEEADARRLGFDDEAYRLLALDIELNAQGLAVAAEAMRQA